MEILINGLCDSAGKTTATVGLFQNFENRNIGLYKPFAANDYWYDHSVVMESIKQDRLYGHDAKTLAEFVKYREEKVNPIHRLWAPASVVGQGIGLGGSNSTMLLDRVSKNNQTILVKNSEIDLPKKLDPVFDSADRILEVSTVEELNNLSEELYLPAAEKRYKKLSEHDILLVESYSDIAMPLTLSPDLVLSVEPGKAYLSDGQKFCEAHEMMSKRWKDYSHELKTGKILDTINSKEIRISPSQITDSLDFEESYSRIFQKIRELLPE